MMITIDETIKPIATWYKTLSWKWEIEPTPVLKISAKQLVIISPYNGRPSTTAKASRSTIYHQTRDEALEYLRERLERLRSQLQTAEAAFAKTEAVAEQPNYQVDESK